MFSSTEPSFAYFAITCYQDACRPFDGRRYPSGSGQPVPPFRRPRGKTRHCVLNFFSDFWIFGMTAGAFIAATQRSNEALAHRFRLEIHQSMGRSAKFGAFTAENAFFTETSKYMNLLTFRPGSYPFYRRAKESRRSESRQPYLTSKDIFAPWNDQFLSCFDA